MKISEILQAAWAEPDTCPTVLGRHLRLVTAVAPQLGEAEVGRSYSELAATYRPQDPPSVTAVVLTWNEEERIGGCLRALRDDCDDVVLVDARSTDATVHTAQLAFSSVKHVTRAWTDDFAAQRNAAFAEVDGSGWLAYVDADETLDAGSRGRLRAVLTALDHVAPDIDLVASPHIVDTSQEDYANTQRVLRARSALRFRGRLHERPYDVKGNSPLWAEVAVTYRHTGYEPSVVESRGKRDQYTRLLRRCLAEEPENPKWRFYAARDGLVGAGPTPQAAREEYRQLHDSLGLYERPGLTDYEREQHTDTLVLLCELAMLFGGGQQIAELAPLLKERGRSLEAAYYACFAESSALLNRASALLDRLSAATGTPRPGSRRLVGRSYDLQGLLALTCGRYDDLSVLLEEARERGSGHLTAGTLNTLRSRLPDWPS
ncbi:glycosyltransferase [Streptomyces salinarius]|uniref:glycosyltransferase n=1 Tax=Streptomyces salinarius TaxID=2762598 RepID=UPI00164906AF|nr:glycosyltransferase [Streptomyces salinarius]